MPARSRKRREGGDAQDELDPVFTAVARYFGLLAEPSRLRILNAICRTECPVSTIVASTGIPQTGVSRHLALLHAAGVVSRRREGSSVWYRVVDPHFVEVCRIVSVRIASAIDERAPLRDGLLAFASDSPRASTRRASGTR